MAAGTIRLVLVEDNDVFREALELLLTASANTRETEALFEAGAVECLTKDRELDEIVAAVQRAGKTAVGKVRS
jgi:DNA-binding NarL/FixJ family response regulator